MPRHLYLGTKSHIFQDHWLLRLVLLNSNYGGMRSFSMRKNVRNICSFSMRKNVRMTWKETLQENVYVMSPMHEDNVSSIYYFEFVLGAYDQQGR
jgi:hypothetical protein